MRHVQNPVTKSQLAYAHAGARDVDQSAGRVRAVNADGLAAVTQWVCRVALRHMHGGAAQHRARPLRPLPVPRLRAPAACGRGRLVMHVPLLPQVHRRLCSVRVLMRRCPGCAVMAALQLS